VAGDHSPVSGGPEQAGDNHQGRLMIGSFGGIMCEREHKFLVITVGLQRQRC
jgi:hypothetical protein